MPNVLTKHRQSLQDYVAWLEQGGQPVPFFTWNDAQYRCNYVWTEQHYLNQGGYVPQDELVLEPLDAFPFPGPQIEDEILFSDDPRLAQKTFRLRAIKHVFGKLNSYQMFCYDPNRGT